MGHPLSIGNFVSQSGASAIITAVTNTYTPYIDIGDEAYLTSRDELIEGTPYQEILTNFPLTSQVLSGLFLNVTFSGPQGPAQTYSQTLVDRIGYAARQGQGSPSGLSFSPTSTPIVSPFDLTTIEIRPGVQSAAASALLAERADAQIAAVPSGAQAVYAGQAAALMAVARADLATFETSSDEETANLARGSSVAAYFGAPAITTFTSRLVFANNTSQITFAVDLIKDGIRAVAAPGQNGQAQLSFAAARGIFDSALESQVLPTASGAKNLSLLPRLSSRPCNRASPLRSSTRATSGPCQASTSLPMPSHGSPLTS